MQTMQEWMLAHNYHCPEAAAFALDYTDVADCWDRTGNIEYMLIGAWEHAMDGLWDGGRSFIEAWIVDVQAAYPSLVAGDLWPIGAFPENSGRFEYYDTAREFANGILAACVDERYAVTVGADLCARLRLAVPGNPMSNAA